MSFNTSSNKFSARCPDGGTTTNCVQYVGPDVDCLGIKSGCTLSEVECQILQTLCDLVGEVNMNSIVLPSCFIEAWNTTDPTILNFIQFLLNQQCLTNNLLQNVVSGDTQLQNQNPLITITYPNCCQPGACGGGTTVSFSQHITNVLNCLCNLYSLIGTIPSGYTNIGCSLSTILTSLNQIIVNINAQAQNTAIILTVLQNAGYSFPGLNTITPLNPPTGC